MNDSMNSDVHFDAQFDLERVGRPAGRCCGLIRTIVDDYGDLVEVVTAGVVVDNFGNERSIMPGSRADAPSSSISSIDSRLNESGGSVDEAVAHAMQMIRLYGTTYRAVPCVCGHDAVANEPPT